MREQQFQLHGSEEPPRTSVTARAEVHVDAVGAGEIVFVAVGGTGLARPVVSETVKSVAVGGHVGIEEDISGCN